MNSCSQLRTHAVHYGQRNGVIRFASLSTGHEHTKFIMIRKSYNLDEVILTTDR